MAFFDNTLQDLRFGLRLIRKYPLLSAAMVATLAFGIGLDAGAFTLIDGMLLRTRVERDPGRFVQVEADYSGQTRTRTEAMPGVSLRDFEAYRAAGATTALIASRALAAMLGPARRAAAVDPVFALRQE